MMCRWASVAFDVICAESGTHVSFVVHRETCVGARLCGHDAPREAVP